MIDRAIIDETKYETDSCFFFVFSLEKEGIGATLVKVIKLWFTQLIFEEE